MPGMKKGMQPPKKKATAKPAPRPVKAAGKITPRPKPVTR